jgi:hypothetical protein
MTLTPIRAIAAGALVLATMVRSAQATRIGAGDNPCRAKGSSGLLSATGAARSQLANASSAPAIPMATPVVGKLNFNTGSFDLQVRALAPLALLGLGGIVLTLQRERGLRHG